MTVAEIVKASNGKLEGKEVEKNGKTLNGIFIKRDMETASSIIYEESVEALTSECETVEEAVDTVYNYLKECDNSDERKAVKEMANGVLSSSENILNNLQIRVISEKNVGTKEPIKTFGDMAFFYQIFFDCGDGASTLIPKESIERIKDELGVTDEEIWERAVKNTANTLNYSSFMGIMPVVSNKHLYYGSSILFVSGDARLDVAEKFGCGEYYIIPSSTHEVILVSANEGRNVEDIKVMLDTVNPTLSDTDYLSEHIYYVDGDGRLSVAC